MRRLYRWSPIPVVAAAALVFSGTAAGADTGGGDSADGIAELVAEAAPVPVEPVELVPAGDELVAEVESGTVVLPTAGDGEIRLTDDESGVSLDLTLPAEADAAAVQVAEDGTVVYEGASDVAVQATEDGGVRIATVLADASSPMEYTYTFGAGVDLELQDDGSVLLSSAGEVVGMVDAPWAVDAAGAAVATGYDISGHDLVQTITPDAATTYPVIADPKVSIGKYIYMYFTNAEVKNVVKNPVAKRAAWIAVICGAIPNGIAGSACALYVTNNINSVYNTFVSASRTGKRVELRFLILPTGAGTWGAALVGWKTLT